MAPRKGPRRSRNNKVTIEDATENVADDEKPDVEPGEEETAGVSPEEQAVWDAVREEQYEVIEQLPLTLQRMFALLRELDERYTAQVNEMQKTIRQYTKLRQTIDTLTKPPPPPEEAPTEHPTKTEAEPDLTSTMLDSIFDLPATGETRKLLSKIAWLNAESVRTSEEKLALATTAYDLVDRHVRSLDLTIKAEEASFALGLRPGTLPNTSVLQTASSSSTANPGIAGLGMKSTTTTDELPAPLPSPTTATSASTKPPRVRNRSRKRRPPHAKRAEDDNGEVVLLDEPPPQSPSVDVNGVALPSQTNNNNMAIDPNEPRYCYCNQVSFGEMIGCDNEDCEREWFHYACAGITETPKRSWFCRDCEVALGIQGRRDRRNA